MAVSSSTEYLAYSGPGADDDTTQVGTLTRSTWLAQSPLTEQPKKKIHTPPSPLNLILAFLACFFCPFIGWLSIIFAIQAKTEYNKGSYNESAALCNRSRGTSIYSIAIGIGLGIGYGVIVGAGLNLGWYE